MANKIKYGLKNVYYALATINSSTGAATYETPVRIPGAVSLEMEPSGEQNNFYADNIAYASFSANAGYEGTLEVAMLPDSFRQDVLGEVLDDDSKIQYETTAATTSPFALLFQFEGDDNAVRHVFYNCTASRTNVNGQTTEESVEVKTESVELKASAIFNAVADTDIVKGKCSDKTADAYTNWFTAVQQPAETPEPGPEPGPDSET